MYIEEDITITKHISDDDEITQEVILHTNNLLNETKLYLGRQTKGDVKAYVELVFQIDEYIEDPNLAYLINNPPKFS